MTNERSIEVVIEHARNAVEEAENDDGWVMIKAPMLSMLLGEIERLRGGHEPRAARTLTELSHQVLPQPTMADSMRDLVTRLRRVERLDEGEIDTFCREAMLDAAQAIELILRVAQNRGAPR